MLEQLSSTAYGFLSRNVVIWKHTWSASQQIFVSERSFADRVIDAIERSFE